MQSVVCLKRKALACTSECCAARLLAHARRGAAAAAKEARGSCPLHVLCLKQAEQPSTPHLFTPAIPPTLHGPRYCHAPHAGPIVALAKSPFVEGLVASVGDWCFKLWSGDSTTPLFSSPFAEEVYTAGGCMRCRRIHGCWQARAWQSPMSRCRRPHISASSAPGKQ